MKYGQNTDLNNQNVQYWEPLKSQKRAKNETQSQEKLKHNQAKKFKENHKKYITKILSQKLPKFGQKGPKRAILDSFWPKR